MATDTKKAQTTKPEVDAETAATASDQPVNPEPAVRESSPTDYAQPESTDDLVFVTMPDGSTRAFTRAQVRDSQARSAVEFGNGSIAQAVPPVPEEDVYLWLAD